MKNLKHAFVIGIVLAISFFITQANMSDYLLKGLILFILLLATFNLLFRKSLGLKKYFTNKYNIFTSKFRSETTYDISKDLMFEKVIEVLNNSNFKIAKIDKLRLEILATTPITFTSCGEILYINFDSGQNGSRMKFCSVTSFGAYSWGKNENNYQDILKEIEDSLTV